jgi:hypothetical protein
MNIKIVNLHHAVYMYTNCFHVVKKHLVTNSLTSVFLVYVATFTVQTEMKSSKTNE